MTDTDTGKLVNWLNHLADTADRGKPARPCPKALRRAAATIDALQGKVTELEALLKAENGLLVNAPAMAVEERTRADDAEASRAALEVERDKADASRETAERDRDDAYDLGYAAGKAALEVESAGLRAVLEECVTTMAHARVFVTSRARIKSPEGEELYDEAVEGARQALFRPSSSPSAVADRIWAALKQRCAAHPPSEHDKVKHLVMVSEDDVHAAIAALPAQEKETQA
jgi:hypothetical protein